MFVSEGMYLMPSGGAVARALICLARLAMTEGLKFSEDCSRRKKKGVFSVSTHCDVAAAHLMTTKGTSHATYHRI